MHFGRRGFRLATRVASAWVLSWAMVLQMSAGLAAQGAPAPGVAPVSGSQAEGPLAHGVIVRYKHGTTPALVLQTLESVGVQAAGPANAQGLQVMSLARGVALDSALAALRSDPRVEYAEPNYELAATVAPDDTRYAEQWGLSTTAGIWAENAWATATNLLGVSDPAVVTVAVLDTGVDATHEDLSGRVLAGHNAITGATDLADTNDDSANGHGTHAAGIIAASTDNALGVAGTAGTFPVQVLPVKVLDSYGTGTLYDIAQGIRWAVDQGARVLNLSLGARLPDYPVTLAEAVKYAQDHGALVVAAAGNEGFDLEGFYPAALPGVLSVGASGSDGQLAAFSNQGSAAIAPGVDILSTVPGHAYGTRSGTSMAAPFVSGTAALMWTVYPSKSAVAVATAIAAGHTAYGSGLVLNANLALTKLDQGVVPQPSLTLLQPQADAYAAGRHVSGMVQVLAQATNPADVSRVDFILNQGQADETVVGSVYSLGGPAESGLFELNWDSSQVADGLYELTAQAYGATGNPTTSSWVMVIVANQQVTGLALKVLKPDGTPAAGAQVAVFHAYTGYSSVPYSSLALAGAQDYAYLNYEWVWEGTTDLGGDLTVSGASATDGNDYLVIVQGSDFLYHRLVRAPSQAVLDATAAQTVTITGRTVAGQPLTGALLVGDLLEASVPLTTNVGASVIAQYPLASLGADGQAEFTLSPGHYNFRLVSPSDSYYLARRDVVVDDQTSALAFTPTAAEVATLELAPDSPPTSTAIALSDQDVWGSYGFVVDGTRVNVTPGTYVAEVTSLYPDATAGAERLWTVRTQPFQAAAQATHRIFLGSLASAELSHFGSANPSGPTPGSSVSGQLSFADAYGNVTTEMLSQPYVAGASAAAAVGALPSGVVLQRTSPKLNSGATGLPDGVPPLGPTSAYNPATGRFEPVVQGFTAVRPGLEVRDAGDSVIYSGTASYWQWGSWYIPLVTPLGAYTIRATAAVGNLGRADSGGVVTSNTVAFDIQAPVPVTTPPDLTVTVLDRNGDILPGARATLLKQAGDTYSAVPWRVATTDSAGQAKFSSLYYRSPIGLAVTGVSANPAEPGAAAEPFFIFVSLGTLTMPASVAVDASASPMHRVVLQAQNTEGAALDSGNVPYYAYGEDEAGRQGGVYIGNPNSAGGQPLWLREGRHAFQAGNDGQTVGRPTVYALLSGPVDVPAGVPTDGTTGDKTVVLGGPGLAAIQVSSDFDSTDEALQGVTVFHPDMPGASSPFYSLLTAAGGPLVPIYVMPGTYQVQSLATRAHYDGEWDYWLEGNVVALTPADQGPVVTGVSLDLGAAIQLDSSTYSAGSMVRSSHSFLDPDNNRLIAVATNMGLVGGSSLQAWRQPGAAPALITTPDAAGLVTPIQTQTHEEIAPFLVILDPNGSQVYRHKDPATTFFGDTYVIPATAAVGSYTAVLELGAGPDGDFRVQTSFTVGAGGAVPHLNAPPSPTNLTALTLTGTAAPGASVTVICLTAGGVSPEAGPVLAGSGGTFSLEVPLPDEGDYSFSAMAELNGESSGPSNTVTVHVDRTAPAAPGNLSATPLKTSQVRLTWASPADADIALYRIRREGTPVAEVYSDQTLTFLDSGLQAGQEYGYQVTAVDTAGNESAAAAATVRTNTAPTPPPASGGSVIPPLSPTDEEGFVVGPDGLHFNPFDGVLEFTVPPDAFPINGMLIVRRVKDLPRPVDPTLALVSPVFEFEPSTQPQKPLDLTVRYDPTQLNGADPRSLGVYHQDDQNPAQWTYQGGVVALDAHTVQIRLSHFSRYAVMARNVSFADLSGHWSRQDVELLASRGLVTGVSAAEFQPDRAITRAELTKLLVEMLGRNPQAALSLDAPAAPTFQDVATSAWYYRYVETAARLGIVKGADGLFRPNGPVTREEMATMFVRALGHEVPAQSSGSELSYADASQISAWARGYVAAARQAGLMKGGANNGFEPKGSATRAQGTVVVLRAMERQGWVSSLVELTGVLTVSEIEGRHYELEVTSANGTVRYVLIAMDGADSPAEQALAQAVGQEVTVKALYGSPVSAAMRGQVLRVVEATPGQ